MTKVSILLAASVLTLAGLLRAHDEHLPRAWVEPGRDRWVTSPLDLEISFFDVSAAALGKIKPGSLAIEVNGIDVTDAFLAVASLPGGVELRDLGNTVALKAKKIALAAGKYRVRVHYELATGGVQSFEQAFRVYDPIEVLRRLGIVAKKTKNSVSPLRVETGAGSVQPPPVFLAPHDKAFVHASTTDLRVTWAKGGAGMQMRALKILLDGVDVTSKFSVGAGEARWQGAPVKNGKRVLVAQVADHTGALRVATSTFIVFDGSKRKPHFYAPTNGQHPYAHTHHQFQWYSGGQSSAYFHHGSDINRPAGSRVYACEGGNITNFNWYDRQPYYFEVEITDPDGFRWQYHHVDYPKIPQSVRNIAAQKGFVARGTDIGANVYWPARAYGKLFHHIHLNVIAPDGRYVNAMNFLPKLQDTVKPSVHAVYLTQNGSQNVLNPGGSSGATVGGKLDIVARAEDLVQGEPYQLTIYRLTYEIEELTGNKSHHLPETQFWRFDYLPGGANRFGNVWDVFRYRLLDGSYLYTRGDYGQRIFYYTLTNRIGDTQVSESLGYWDSARPGIDGPLFPNGQYRVTVRAYDIAGNVGSRSITLNLKN